MGYDYGDVVDANEGLNRLLVVCGNGSTFDLLQQLSTGREIEMNTFVSGQPERKIRLRLEFVKE